MRGLLLKTFACCLLPLAFFGCAVRQGSPQAATGGDRIISTYDLEKITVVVYPDAQTLVAKLDPVRRMVMESMGAKFYGYVQDIDSAKPTIHTINDLSNFLHELRHYLAPEWRHAKTCETKDSCLEPFVTRRAANEIDH